VVIRVLLDRTVLMVKMAKLVLLVPKDQEDLSVIRDPLEQGVFKVHKVFKDQREALD
jgi:hypothetical protein